MNAYVRIEYSHLTEKLLTAAPDSHVPAGHEVVARTAQPEAAEAFIEQMQEVLPLCLPVYQYRVMFTNYLNFGRVQ